MSFCCCLFLLSHQHTKHTNSNNRQSAPSTSCLVCCVVSPFFLLLLFLSRTPSRLEQIPALAVAYPDRCICFVIFPPHLDPLPLNDFFYCSFSSSSSQSALTAAIDSHRPQAVMSGAPRSCSALTSSTVCVQTDSA